MPFFIKYSSLLETTHAVHKTKLYNFNMMNMKYSWSSCRRQHMSMTLCSRIRKTGKEKTCCSGGRGKVRMTVCPATELWESSALVESWDFQADDPSLSASLLEPASWLLPPHLQLVTESWRESIRWREDVMVLLTFLEKGTRVEMPFSLWRFEGG